MAKNPGHGEGFKHKIKSFLGLRKGATIPAGLHEDKESDEYIFSPDVLKVCCNMVQGSIPFPPFPGCRGWRVVKQTLIIRRSIELAQGRTKGQQIILLCIFIILIAQIPTAPGKILVGAHQKLFPCTPEISLESAMLSARADSSLSFVGGHTI